MKMVPPRLLLLLLPLLVLWSIAARGSCYVIQEPEAPDKCRYPCEQLQYLDGSCNCIDCISVEAACSMRPQPSVCRNLARYGYCTETLQRAALPRTRKTVATVSRAKTSSKTAITPAAIASSIAASMSDETPSRDQAASSSGTMAMIAVVSVVAMIVVIAVAAGVVIIRWCRNRTRKNRGDSMSDKSSGAPLQGYPEDTDDPEVGCRKTTNPTLPPEGSVSLIRSRWILRSSQDLRPDSPAPDIPAGSMRSGPACRGVGGRLPLFWHVSMPALGDCKVLLQPQNSGDNNKL